jgi:phytoene/squalene synthetase
MHKPFLVAAMDEATPRPGPTDTAAWLSAWVGKTSGTLGSVLPLLPVAARDPVGVAYVLFRIADAFARAPHWRRDRRAAALRRLSALMDVPGAGPAQGLAAMIRADAPAGAAGWAELPEQIPAALAAARELRPGPRDLLRTHLRRSIEATIDLLGPDAGARPIRLASLADVAAYGQAGGGIAAEMLTELFLRERLAPLGAAAFLRARAARLGAALALVTVLRDDAGPAAGRRCDLAPDLARDAVHAAVREGLEAGAGYALALQEQRAHRGLVAFAAALVRVAAATMAVLAANRTSRTLTRGEVFSMLVSIQRDLDARRPVVPRDTWADC